MYFFLILMICYIIFFMMFDVAPTQKMLSPELSAPNYRHILFYLFIYE